MKKFWKAFRKKEEIKSFAAIQIEVSSLCNLQCQFCPTTFIKDSDKRNIMSLEDVKKLEPFLKKTHWVYLQGWGEPLLNSGFWEIVEFCKGTGARVGFTTNGTLLDEEKIAKIIDYKVDLVSTSIAGATQDTHGQLRTPSQLEKILNNIKLLVNAKTASGNKSPIITLSYMLTTQSIHDLPDAVKIAYELGVDDFYTTNLDYVFSEEANQSKLFSWDGEEIDEYRKLIDLAEEYAVAHDFSFRSYPLKFQEEKGVCDLNPAKMIFITSNGDVTPCTYLGRFINPRFFKGQKIDLPRKVFGNIHTEEIEAIWNNPIYRAFRKPFIVREQAHQDLLNVYLDIEPSLSKIKNAESRYLKILQDNPWPEECTTCSKVYGI